MNLSIIIVNWNSREFLAKCIPSIMQYTVGIEYEIIVIDSGSFDGSAELVRDRFPQVLFIQNEKNVGFARANNMAFCHAAGRNILFLNPDTELLSPAINHMLTHLESSPKAGAIGCRLVNYDDTLQTSCVQSFPSILGQVLMSDWLMKQCPKAPIWGISALFQNNASIAEVEVISGACLMIRREVFEKIGGFSEDYFMYTEDIDLCYKARLAGYHNYYVPFGVVKHYGGGSSEYAPSDFSVIMMRDSIRRYFGKYRGKTYANIYRLSTGVAGGLRLLILTAFWPVVRWRAGPTRHRGAIRKWYAVVRWSIIGSADHDRYKHLV